MRRSPICPTSPGARLFRRRERPGAGVTDFKVGDAVFGVCAVGQEQAYAEKIAIQAAIVCAKPAGLSHVECAAQALIGLTALCSVEDTLQLKAGESILIHGGAGGVASYAIQLAKHIGARVITTASAANHDYLRQLGAGIRSSTTTRRISPRSCRAWMPCSTPWAAM